jgi:hypothetical protein
MTQPRLNDAASPMNGIFGPTPNNTPAAGPLPSQPVEMLLDKAMHELQGVRARTVQGICMSGERIADL